MKSLIIRILILASMLWMVSATELGSPTTGELLESRLTARRESDEKIKLVLRTDKIKYHRDEAITVYIQLENIGEQPVYVNDAFEIDSSVSQGSSLALEILDSTGHPLLGRGFASGAYANYPSDVVEIIKSHYFLLGPRHFWGVRRTMRTSVEMKRGGKYKLVATYANLAPAEWKAEDKAKLKYDVLGGTLTSEIWIEILP